MRHFLVLSIMCHQGQGVTCQTDKRLWWRSFVTSLVPVCKKRLLHQRVIFFCPISFSIKSSAVLICWHNTITTANIWHRLWQLGNLGVVWKPSCWKWICTVEHMPMKKKVNWHWLFDSTSSSDGWRKPVWNCLLCLNLTII